MFTVHLDMTFFVLYYVFSGLQIFKPVEVLFSVVADYVDEFEIKKY